MDACPHCGARLPAVHDAFCPECEGDLSEPPERPVAPEERQHRQRQRRQVSRFIFLQALGAMLAVGGLLEFFTRSRAVPDAPHHDYGDGEPRPWERPGAVRRDCLPHRGHWLRPLGTAALVLSTLTLCWGMTGLFGLPLAVAVWVSAARDLARMRAGTVDPAGIPEAEQARRLAGLAAVLAGLGLALWGSCFAYLLWR